MSMKLRLAGIVVALASTAAVADRALLEAVEFGDRVTAIGLLDQGSDPRSRAPDGSTALMFAAHHGDLELVERLIAAGAGADVNVRNDYGAFALSEAAIVGSAPIVAALLQAGADPNLTNLEGETALMAVARTGNVEAARLLLEAGADINAMEQWGGQSALMWAASQSQPRMVRFLAANGADLNARGVVRNWERRVINEPRPKDMNRGGFTPLLYAAREGCIACARYLLEAGADPDLPDPERHTALNLALINLHFDFAAFMIGAGADIDKWDLFGRTPLYLAVDVSTLPVMGDGAMVVLPSADDHTALDIVRMLLEAGADPNIQLKRRPPYRNVPQDRGGDNMLSQGATPLLRAARAGDAPAVELLLAYGALVDLPSAYGVTPLMAAAGVDFGNRVTRGRNRTEAGVLATVQLLLDAGADVNARNLTEPPRGTAGGPFSNPEDFSYERRGRQAPSPQAVSHQTALHGAAARGLDSVVNLLVAHGADLEARDANGRTPLGTGN
jgi:uncharacterized protein